MVEAIVKGLNAFQGKPNSEASEHCTVEEAKVFELKAKKLQAELEQQAAQAVQQAQQAKSDQIEQLTRLVTFYHARGQSEREAECLIQLDEVVKSYQEGVSKSMK